MLWASKSKYTELASLFSLNTYIYKSWAGQVKNVGVIT